MLVGGSKERAEGGRRLVNASFKARKRKEERLVSCPPPQHLVALLDGPDLSYWSLLSTRLADTSQLLAVAALVTPRLAGVFPRLSLRLLLRSCPIRPLLPEPKEAFNDPESEVLLLKVFRRRPQSSACPSMPAALSEPPSERHAPSLPRASSLQQLSTAPVAPASFRTPIAFARFARLA